MNAQSFRDLSPLLSRVDVVWAGVHETCWPQGKSQPQNCMQWCLESPVYLHQPWGLLCHPVLLWEEIDLIRKLKTLFSSYLSNTLQNVWPCYTNMELISGNLMAFYTHTHTHTHIWGFPVPQWLTFRLPSRRSKFNPWVRKIPWRRKWQPAPVFLTGKSHGQRSLVGYSPWDCRVRRN